MSATMDSQDLLGSVRGLCLIAVVRRGGPLTFGADVERVLGAGLRAEVTLLGVALESFCGIDGTSVRAVAEELVSSSGDYFARNNLNMQLGLLCGRPLPEYPFLTDAGVDSVALTRPYLDVSRNLVHAAVRLRMHVEAERGPDEFWPAVTRFISQAWDQDTTSRALAHACVVNAVSDVLFHNWDLEKRTTDGELVRRARRVFEELRGFPLAMVPASA